MVRTHEKSHLPSCLHTFLLRNKRHLITWHFELPSIQENMVTFTLPVHSDMYFELRVSFIHKVYV